MNRRIDDFSIEAAEYADMYFDDNTDAWMHFYSDKFAELIVRECAEFIDKDIDGYFPDGNQLLEHFGVEE